MKPLSKIYVIQLQNRYGHSVILTFWKLENLESNLVLAMNHTTFLMTCEMQHVVLVLGLLISLELVSLHLMS